MIKNTKLSRGKLIITRNWNDSFVIRLADHVDPSTPIGEIFDDHITISLINCPRQIQISIEADKSFNIMRSELLETEKEY